jgi:predicted metal-dependent hydrolase
MLEIRNYRFATGPDVPRHWHGGRRAVTRFFDNLSVFFPVGERFFVASVRAFADAVKDDPEVRAAIRVFCAQEGIHGREHRDYNAMLLGQGVPVDGMEERVERLLAFVTKTAPRRWQLAATAALEHFTAILGHLLLERPELLEGADETMAALWRWHAAEENEHKAVAYDVYRAAGGTYPERAFVMLVTAVIFWAKVVEHQARFMHADGDLFSAREHARLQRFLWVSPGALPPMWRLWLEWFRPGFHPDDLDASEALDAWRASQA